jgi:two-component system, NarL family, response regulator LiaR
MPVPRIAILEDDKPLLDSLCMLLQLNDAYEICGAFTEAESAIEEIEILKPDAVLVDINLPGMSGLQFVQQAKTLLPQTLFLMCTSHEDSDVVFESLHAGASGYILKTEEPSKILSALKEMLEGGSPMTTIIARKVVERFNAFGGSTNEMEVLSQREKEVLQFLAKGLMNKEVADALDISIGTVRKHIQHIYEKLHVNTRVEAVNIYLKRKQ